MVNNNAILLLNNYFENNRCFYDAEDLYSTNVAVYSYLKKELEKGDILSNYLFQWVFSVFYKMTFISSQGKAVFFDKMDSLKKAPSILDALSIVKELKPAMGGYQFSFVTKMLNLLDDTTYPIYDSVIGFVFKKPIRPGETRLEYHASIYQDVIDTFFELKQHSAIYAFRERFNCPEMGFAKVLDILFWRIGMQSKDKNKKHQI